MISLEKKRIQIIDATRGLAVILMVGHHALYDLSSFFDKPIPFLSSGLFYILQAVFSGLFIFVAGLCCRFSRNNLKRGAIAFLFGLIITAVTMAFIPQEPIYFGILHFLGVSMMLYSIVKKPFERVKDILIIVIFFAVYLIIGRFLPAETNASPYLFPFGLYLRSFVSADYYPILPHIFLFFSGTGFGGIVKDNKLPKWFYETKVPFFPVVGRHSLVIYMVHQPFLMGIFWVISKFI